MSTSLPFDHSEYVYSHVHLARILKRALEEFSAADCELSDDVYDRRNQRDEYRTLLSMMVESYNKGKEDAAKVCEKQARLTQIDNSGLVSEIKALSLSFDTLTYKHRVGDVVAWGVFGGEYVVVAVRERDVDYVRLDSLEKFSCVDIHREVDECLHFVRVATDGECELVGLKR